MGGSARLQIRRLYVAVVAVLFGAAIRALQGCMSLARLGEAASGASPRADCPAGRQ